ncbi:MAG: ABC transporter substrate-binding protein [Phycisphaerae bacterium]|nr:ABC transporter substrate-binding protein [Phycisphaerae bacterium]
MSDPVRLTLAHSADADDVFMWWPITGKIHPRPPAHGGPHDVLSPPVLDTGRFRFVAVPEDIQILNARAIESADLDITALSFHAYARVASQYRLTACGWSMGEGFGPKLVCRRDRARSLEDLSGPAAGKPPRVAIPGMHTTAFMVLGLMLGGAQRFRPVPMRFDSILDAVASGSVDAGLLIHEAQIDFERHGVHALADLGAWWGQATSGLPLPLGANALRRDLDQRFGPGATAQVAGLLRASIEHALANRAEGLAYARTFSPPISDADLDRYVSMYVSPLTVDPGARGLRAVRTLFERAAAAGLCQHPGTLDPVG